MSTTALAVCANGLERLTASGKGARVDEDRTNGSSHTRTTIGFTRECDRKGARVIICARFLRQTGVRWIPTLCYISYDRRGSTFWPVFFFMWGSSTNDYTALSPRST